MLPTPITEQAGQQEWNTVCTIARNNEFPLQIVDNLRNKIMKTQKKYSYKTQRKNGSHFCITFRSYTELPACSKVPT
jgi:hypothetical protein